MRATRAMNRLFKSWFGHRPHLSGPAANGRNYVCYDLTNAHLRSPVCPGARAVPICGAYS